jgi:hypothetical protein
MDPVPHPTETPQFLDVQVHQLAREGPLVPPDGGRGRPGAAREPEAPLDLHHGRQRQPEIPRDPERAPAPLPAPGDLAAAGAGERSGGAVRPTGAICQAGDPFLLVPPPPPPHAGGAEIERCRQVAEPFAGFQAPDHPESPHGGKPR